jgi:aryl-alcohol dehydrogenase-like predicted oxidoreductase
MPKTHEFRLGGDLRIARLGFGAMRLPRADWHGPARDPETGRAVLRRAIELGVNQIDTADFYRSGDGAVRANVLIHEALHPYPSGLVIATKVGPVFGPSGLRAAAPSELRKLVIENLESLHVDRLDLVYLRVGVMTPPHAESIAERFEVLAKLREEGLIRHLGVSNVDAAHLAEARAIAPVAAVQNSFNIAKRDDVSVLEACAKGGIAFVPFGPIGGGNGEIADDRVARVAARHDATVSQIALAWLLALSPVTLAIPGTGSLPHLEENMAARSILLTADDLTELGV